MIRARLGLVVLALLAATGGAGASRGYSAADSAPAYLRDRGAGMPLSMFGTYIEKGQLVVYPFFEYYRDSNLEYAPDELGRSQDTDYRGKYEATEELLFVAYGISDRLTLEMEGAIVQAELETSAEDHSGLPREIVASGLGDVEGQLRWRWAKETAGRPEVFSYFETVVPTQPEGSLIGTTDWEFKLGSGLVRGFSWGTMTVRGAVAYDRGAKDLALGEVALEYLRRLSPKWRVYAGIEGTQDEIELITEAQLRLSRKVFLKANSGFGLTSKATDWAPEVGVLFIR